MTPVVLLISLGVLLEAIFLMTLWPPWRSQYPAVALLLVSLAGVLAAYDFMILLATLRIPVPWPLALAVLISKDSLLIWRIVVVYKARRPGMRGLASQPYQRRIPTMNEILTMIPAPIRKWVYAGAALLALIWGAWQAADGNWKLALSALVTTLLGAMANANVNPDPPQEEEQPALRDREL